MSLKMARDQDQHYLDMANTATACVNQLEAIRGQLGITEQEVQACRQNWARLQS
jgi:hypothetical protein